MICGVCGKKLTVENCLKCQRCQVGKEIHKRFIEFRYDNPKSDEIAFLKKREMKLIEEQLRLNEIEGKCSCLSCRRYHPSKTKYYMSSTHDKVVWLIKNKLQLKGIVAKAFLKRSMKKLRYTNSIPDIICFTGNKRLFIEVKSDPSNIFEKIFKHLIKGNHNDKFLVGFISPNNLAPMLLSGKLKIAVFNFDYEKDTLRTVLLKPVKKEIKTIGIKKGKVGV